MTTPTVQAVVAAAQQLSPAEQFEVVQALTRVLQQRDAGSYGSGASVAPHASRASLPSLRRTPMVTNLADFAADFWPEDETADDLNQWIAQQRAADRLSDLADGDV
ncbi:MAG: hypothetical protein EOM24_01945 [Chloroflexia bacterium]|nr:hypothetical protein [Chloroflexia bacterium]